MEFRSNTYPTQSQRNARTEMDKEIRHLAYRFWEQRGRQSGHDLEDWLQAERELTKLRSRAAATS